MKCEVCCLTINTNCYCHIGVIRMPADGEHTFRLLNGLGIIGRGLKRHLGGLDNPPPPQPIQGHGCRGRSLQCAAVWLLLPGHMAPLRDYVDLFDSTAQQIRDNATRNKLDDGGYEWRHTIITGTLTHTQTHLNTLTPTSCETPSSPVHSRTLGYTLADTSGDTPSSPVHSDTLRQTDRHTHHHHRYTQIHLDTLTDTLTITLTIITSTLTHTWTHTHRHEWRHTIITGTLTWEWE